MFFWKIKILILNFLSLGVYGPCDRKRRRELWKELGAVAGLEDWPWVVGGDFNITRFEDKRAGRAKNTMAMRDFSRFIDDMELIDLPLHGGQYTWFRGNNEHSASRIDRFLISSQRDNSFKAIKQSVLPRVESDHCPILLECGEWERSKGYFKFENMWFEHVNFISTVEKWWNSYDFQGRPDVVLAKKLRKLKEDLKKWNKETFGHLGTRKDQILHQLEMEQQNDNHDSNT